MDSTVGIDSGRLLRLTVERQRLGWSKRELACRAGLDQGSISKFELGRALPYPGQLAKLARALRVPVRQAARLMEHV